MKAAIIIILSITLIYLYFPVNGQKIEWGVAEILMEDIDADGIQDTLWYNKSDTCLVFRLSSHPVRSLVYKYEMQDMSGSHSYLGAHKGGFSITGSHMRSWETYTYVYEWETKRFRLSGYFHENYGNASNDGSGTMSLNLIDGEFIGDWNYYDYEIDSLIPLPEITVQVENQPFYLDDDEIGFIFPGYDLFEIYKNNYQAPGKDTVRFIKNEFDYDYESAYAYAGLVGETPDGNKYSKDIAGEFVQLYQDDIVELTTKNYAFFQPADSGYRVNLLIEKINILQPGKLHSFYDSNKKQINYHDSSQYAETHEHQRIQAFDYFLATTKDRRITKYFNKPGNFEIFLSDFAYKGAIKNDDFVICYLAGINHNDGKNEKEICSVIIEVRNDQIYYHACNSKTKKSLNLK